MSRNTQNEPTAWAGVSGSWRQTCPELEQDIEAGINKALDDGKGIVSGGALGVDYRATAISLERFPDGSRTKIIIPTPLDTFASHYRKRAQEGVITQEQAEDLIKQLETVSKLGSLTTMNHSELTVETYFDRDTQVVDASTELLAYQVNNSAGVQDTVEKARAKGIPVNLQSYTVN